MLERREGNIIIGVPEEIEKRFTTHETSFTDVRIMNAKHTGWDLVRSLDYIHTYKGKSFPENYVIKAEGRDGVWNIELDLIKKIGKTKDCEAYKKRQMELYRLEIKSIK
jgi:hypothetical protein